MAGVFQTMVKVYNRAPVPLSITFDGQQYTCNPGHDAIPDVTVPFAKNQNPIMGSQDPNNPHMSGARYLIVEKGDEGFDVPLTKDEWEAHLKRPCRIDELAIFEERYSGDPKARQVVLNAGRKSTATSRAEAGSDKGGADFSRKD